METSNKINKVCVYCASSTKPDRIFFEAAKQLGNTLALNNITTVYGGGSVGLMGCLAEAVLEAKGTIIGVIPKFMMELEWGNPNITEMIIVDTMGERKQKLIANVDAVIAMPGGTGTLEELSEVISLKKLGLFNKPIILLNTKDFFNPFVNFIEKMIAENFIHANHQKLFSVTSDPEKVIDAINNAPLWTEDDFRFAAI